MSKKISSSYLPDIVLCENSKNHKAPLDKVGMSSIEVPIQLETQDIGKFFTSANASAYVSLDNSSCRGIHMSRLYPDNVSLVTPNTRTAQA